MEPQSSEAAKGIGREQLETIGRQAVDSAMQVHRELAPGLLESADEMAFARKLHLRGVHFERQRSMPVAYKDLLLDCGYRIDFLDANSIVVELKAVEELLPVHEAQVFTYLKLARLNLGYFISFNCRLLKDGLKRIVLGLPDLAPPALR